MARPTSNQTQAERSRPPPFQFGNGQNHNSQQQYTSDSNHPNNEFSFRPVNAQPGPHFQRERRNTSPNPPRRKPTRPYERGNLKGQNDNQQGNAPTGPSSFRRRDQRADTRRGGRPYRPYHPRPFSASARPLLSLLPGQREPTPEQMQDMSKGSERFRPVEELSDDEKAMSVASSDTSEGEISEHSIEPPRKKARNNDGDSVPTWSNPDPYTVLPPVEKAKGKDVIMMIRKAKATPNAAKDVVSETANFISFDFGDEATRKDDDGTDEESFNGGVNTTQVQIPRPALTQALSFPMNSQAARSKAPPLPPHPPGWSEAPPRLSGPPPVWNAPPLPPGPPPSASNATEVDVWPPPLPPGPPPSAPNATAVNVWPPPPPPPVQKTRGLKRGHDEVSGSSSNNDMATRQGRKPGQTMQGLAVTKAWRVPPNAHPAPWHTRDHSPTRDVNSRLHKEICDFHQFVRPLKYEQDVREALVSRLQKFLERRKEYAGARIDCFGSFAAGIYLPDADMDLVVRSEEFMRGGDGTLGYKKSLWSFGTALEKAGFTDRANLTVIAKAKVPLVKFVDRLTGLKVDISFENDTGILALDTYRTWKSEYPALEVIVTLIKQFLLMRGLNEVHTGGIGGFTVTCMVVSLLQHMPHSQTNSMKQAGHLGEILLLFFEFYGKKFNTTEMGISVNPPKLFKKRHNRDISFNPAKPWSLCIIDPNRYDNDISSGSHNVMNILDRFSEAYDKLKDRMIEIENTTNISDRRGSILAEVYGGSYKSFTVQRERLRSVYYDGK